MSCWVAPVVAAEMWHCSMEQVLEAVRNGSVPSRMEGGFLLVQVAMAGNVEPVKPRRRPIPEAEPTLAPPPISAPPPMRPDDEIITPQELAALEGRSSVHRHPADWDSSDENEEPVGATADAESTEQARYDVSQWRTIRNETSRLRRPPGKR